MHREAAKATGISEEERQDYRQIRTWRYMGCTKGRRCNNTVLCPTCSFVNWSKQREFFGLAWEKLTTKGYSWQSATVSIRYDTDDEREYQVAAFRERIEVAQIVQRDLWEEHLDVPGAGLAYTIERGRGTRRDRGGHVHLNIIYFGPTLDEQKLQRWARDAHRTRRVNVRLLPIDHAPRGPKSEDPRGSKEGLQRVAKYVSKAGSSAHYDQTIRIADDRALVMDVRFDIASRGTQLSQRLGSLRGLAPKKRAAGGPSEKPPRRTPAPSPRPALHTESSSLEAAGPTVPVFEVADAWSHGAFIWRRLVLPELSDGPGPSTPAKLVQLALDRASNLRAPAPNKGRPNQGCALSYLALGMLSDLAPIPASVSEPAYRAYLLRRIAEVTGTIILAVDAAGEAVVSPHWWGARCWHYLVDGVVDGRLVLRRVGMNPDVPEELAVPMPADYGGGDTVLIDLSAPGGPAAVGEVATDGTWRRTAAWVEVLDAAMVGEPAVPVPEAATRVAPRISVTLEDGECDGHRYSWQAPRENPHTMGTWHESTTTDFVLAMTEHFIPARIGTTNPERILETMAVSSLIDVLDEAEARRLLLPALERLTGWSIVAFDQQRGTLVYDDLSCSSASPTEAGPAVADGT
jgi:hypothetical protein